VLNGTPENLRTANIFNVIFTVFKCVPISTVISLYGLLLQVQLNNYKADLQFFYCNLYIGQYKAIKCKPYSKITVESGTQLKTVHICSAEGIKNIFALLLTSECLHIFAVQPM
jgi:hypothetical protein